MKNKISEPLLPRDYSGGEGDPSEEENDLLDDDNGW